ncbi:MAG: plasmid mobilization relaxosome protein MobC [Muribaculaceae bacterium]|nr:plasmid mobilization relaxosome protein MobC [Muribaculaceae bacterium]
MSTIAIDNRHNNPYPDADISKNKIKSDESDVWGASIGFENSKTTAKSEEGLSDTPETINPQTSYTNKRNKGGRPKLESERKKRYGVKVYFEEENYNKLVWKASVCKLPISRIIYEFAVNGYVKEAVSTEVISLMRRLSGMANNLNQLARDSHTYGFTAIEKDVSYIRNEIIEIIDSVNN